MSAADVYGFRFEAAVEMTIEAEVAAVLAQVEDRGIEDLARLAVAVRDVVRLQIVRDHMAAGTAGDVPAAVLAEVDGHLATARRELAAM